eukprot:CAMPEP_0114492872 /NCGR_PEP_ID=MMETSP0109-20121206/3797_1 /TAXON_ID=29199 /ORGANISM="Chlorarachnion reptans, Strain CCCM449" /LENGTH=255 /DNA_ID=CAMNT_0001669765 /DNA_START=9 /DNA_END=776 /DNA_ORIENTATION=-
MADFVVALYAYEKQHPDEISFEMGDRIRVLEKHQTGWWTGEIKEAGGAVRIGNFPSNFVRQETKAAAAAEAKAGAGAGPQNGAPSAAPKPVKATEDSYLGAFTSTYRDRRLRMILRLCQLLSIIISFGAGSDQDSYTEHDEFKAMVGIGVIVFLYIIAIVICYIFNVESKWTACSCVHENPFNLTEAMFDAIFSLMLLASLIAALHKAESLENTNKAKVSGVFAFITFLLLVGSSIISWRLFKERSDQAFAVQLA